MRCPIICSLLILMIPPQAVAKTGPTLHTLSDLFRNSEKPPLLLKHPLIPSRFQTDTYWEGEAPAEPGLVLSLRLGRGLALPHALRLPHRFL